MNLRRQIKRSGLSVSELARRVGVSRQTIYVWSERPETMSLEHARQLAHVLECTIDEFVSR